jgi:hypothetical protein
MHRHGLSVIGHVEAFEVAGQVVIRLEERAELIGLHDVDLHRSRSGAQRATLYVPLWIRLRPLTQDLDMAGDRFE